MKNPVFIFLFFLWVFNSQAQINLDSLFTVWKDSSQPDTTRLEAIHKIVWEGYLFTRPDSAFYYAQIEHDFAERNGIRLYAAKALRVQGVSFAIRGNYSAALEYFHKSLAIMQEIGDRQGIANSMSNIGLINSNQGNYPRALEYFQKSLAIREDIEDREGIASSLNNIGNIYQEQGNFPRALEYFQKSLEIHEEIGDNQGIAISLNNIGIIYREQGNYPLALEYYQRSLTIYEGIGNKQAIASILSNIGNIYNNQGDYSRALEYNQKGLEIYEEIGNKQRMATNLNNIGNIYQDQGNYPRTLDYCRQGLVLAEEIGVLEQQKNACQCLYETYKAIGKGNDALVYLEKINIIQDSLQAEETTKKLEQMEFTRQALQDSLANAEEARLVQQAHQEEIRRKEITRNWLIAGGFLALLLAGGFFSRWRYVHKSRAIIEKEKERSDYLLLNILPEEIAQELKEKGKADARDFEKVSILFTDFKEFTQTSEKLSAKELVEEINTCFKAFDNICEKYQIEKIKTIGDSYMAAGGIPIPMEDSVKNTVLAGLEMAAFMLTRKAEREVEDQIPFYMRVGIHTGPVVAGIVGVKKFQYDIWGDTVNTASRIESSGVEGKVNISQATYDLIKDDPQFTFESRGKIEAKGKGLIEMYFVDTIINNGK